MPWLLVLHIAALLVWCGALLYLPALIAAGRTGAAGEPFAPAAEALPRAFFTRLATPAALLTIASGTLLFLGRGVHGVWLMLKLSAVTLMVVCHVLLGVLILRLEDDPRRPLAGRCAALGLLAALAIGAVLWLVLARPFRGAG
ncbi:CopD family protein [Azotobacter bryophylli]|uniref:Protoporphyrinogen IX oxidase n=1 Tax=Azotobacter bryophylli TaxID=1986537 RepID=A0ABV7ANT6_9GAMM